MRHDLGEELPEEMNASVRTRRAPGALRRLSRLRFPLLYPQRLTVLAPSVLLSRDQELPGPRFHGVGERERVRRWSADQSAWIVAMDYWLVGTAHGLLAWRLARVGDVLPPEASKRSCGRTRHAADGPAGRGHQGPLMRRSLGRELKASRSRWISILTSGWRSTSTSRAQGRHLHLPR